MKKYSIKKAILKMVLSITCIFLTNLTYKPSQTHATSINKPRYIRDDIFDEIKIKLPKKTYILSYNIFKLNEKMHKKENIFIRSYYNSNNKPIPQKQSNKDMLYFSFLKIFKKKVPGRTINDSNSWYTITNEVFLIIELEKKDLNNLGFLALKNWILNLPDKSKEHLINNKIENQKNKDIWHSKDCFELLDFNKSITDIGVSFDTNANLHFFLNLSNSKVLIYLGSNNPSIKNPKLYYDFDSASKSYIEKMYMLG